MIVRGGILPSGALTRFIAAVGVMLLAAVPAALSQSQPGPQTELTADVQALCTVWRLTETSIKLAAELKSVSDARVEETGKQAEACRAKPECARSSERERLDKALREAGTEQAKAVELAAAMEGRKREIVGRLEKIYGKEAIQKCGGT